MSLVFFWILLASLHVKHYQGPKYPKWFSLQSLAYTWETCSLRPLTKDSESARALAAKIGTELRQRGHFVFDDSDDDDEFAANFSK